MDSDKEKKISDILQQFNRQITKLFKIIDTIVPDDPTIDWAKRIIKIFRNEQPLAVIDRTVDKLWENRVHIMAHDAEFFNTCSFKKYIKEDENKEWLDRLIRLIRTRYYDLKKKEQDYIWSCMEEMLKNVIKYRLIKEDFVDENKQA